MNKSFEIGSREKNSDILLIEAGETYCILSFLNAGLKSLNAFEAYSFEATSLNESISEIMDSIPIDKAFEKVIVSSAFPEALLVPRKFYSSDSLLNVLYHTQNDKCMHDVVGEWQLINSYVVPHSVFRTISSRFPAAQYTHVYTPFLKINNGMASDCQLMVHFMGNQFRVLLKINQQIHLAQTYSYASPMDVVYYLLKIVTEFGLLQEETYLLISGFIDENSALYKELYSFFVNIQFVSAATLNLPQHDHPDHFFTSVHNLAACVL